jgi:hypothetical protein
MFELNPDVSDIAKRYAVGHEGVDLLVLGAVQTAADGCACPESVLLKSLVSQWKPIPSAQHRSWLKGYGVADKVHDFNVAAAKAAKSAIGTKGFVATSVGPTGHIVQDEGGHHSAGAPRGL